MLRRAVAFGALLGAVAAEAHGQTVVGRVTAERDGAALGSVAVTLLRYPNEIVREVLTDAEGRYRLVAPGAGDYRVVTDHLGYQRLDSPLLAVADGQTVTIDFELPTDPIEIEGVEVEVRRAEELRRQGPR